MVLTKQFSASNSDVLNSLATDFKTLTGLNIRETNINIAIVFSTSCTTVSVNGITYNPINDTSLGLSGIFNNITCTGNGQARVEVI